MTSIYALTDPDTGETRYVGKATNPETRLHAHIKTCGNRGEGRLKALWIKSLVDAGKAPVLNVLATVPDKAWSEAERYWMDFFRKKGHRLTNGCAGGKEDMDRSRSLTALFPVAEIHGIKRIAQSEGRTVGSVIREAVREFLKKRGVK